LHYSRARWGPAHFPRVVEEVASGCQDDRVPQDTRHKKEQPHTSAHSICTHFSFLSQSQVMRQLLYNLSDNPSTVDAVIETQLYHGRQPGACGRVTVLTSDGWAIKVELKLHLQMGRSSSIPPEVVATSGSVARMKYENNLGEF
jgi:hypothetical protein